MAVVTKDSALLVRMRVWPCVVYADTEFLPNFLEVDEHPRPEGPLEKLAKLKPAFYAGGTVTAATRAECGSAHPPKATKHVRLGCWGPIAARDWIDEVVCTLESTLHSPSPL